MSDAAENSTTAQRDPHVRGDAVLMPAPTVWPMLLALGLTLAASGFVTYWMLAVAGGALALVGLAGWSAQLFPGRGHEWTPFVPARLRARPVKPAPAEVSALAAGMPGHRMRMPEKIHPYSAGVRGGVFGGVAMAVVAMLFALVAKHSVWYPINLLAGMVMTSLGDATTEQLESFNAAALVIATAIHVVASLIAGLSYGVMLPILPRFPLLFGGLIAPLLWTGVVYGFMGVLNPVMNERVEWRWFIASQFAFGIVAGLVVRRTEMVYAEKTRVLPDATRAE